jgi:hypothetical protein
VTYQAEVLADSPLGYWRLGESSGMVMHGLAATSMKIVEVTV